MIYITNSPEFQVQFAGSKMKIMNSENKQLVLDFIDRIWNRQAFQQLPEFLHPAFEDQSLPPSFPPDASGLEAWIEATGKSFRHQSYIEKIVAENDTVMIKFYMELEHIGPWRDLEPTGALVNAVGYRCFEIREGKIRSHWALIDGNAIENQLRETTHGCKIQQ